MIKKGLWQTLERLPSLEAVLAEWQIMLGKDFFNAQPFLLPTIRQSRTYPCTNRPACGCYHEVIVHTPERIVAVCRCDTRECKKILLQPKDIIIYALDSKKFSKAIQDAFAFNSNENTSFTAKPHRLPVGTHSKTHSPVYFLTQNTEEDFLKELEELISAETVPFILLTPSNQFNTPNAKDVLKRHQSVVIPLLSTLYFRGPGKFTITQSIQPILEQFKKGLGEGSGLVKTVERIDRNIEAVAKNKHELESENEELKRLAKDGLFNFLTQVEADDFRFFIAICMHGDRAKAARALKVKQRTFYDRVNSWPSRGQQYNRMYKMICSVKKLKTKIVSLPGSIQHGGSRNENENPEILHEILQKIKQSSNSSAYPHILQEVFDAILNMNKDNWSAIRKELLPLLQEELPQ